MNDPDCPSDFSEEISQSRRPPQAPSSKEKKQDNSIDTRQRYLTFDGRKGVRVLSSSIFSACAEGTGSFSIALWVRPAAAKCPLDELYFAACDSVGGSKQNKDKGEAKSLPRKIESDTEKLRYQILWESSNGVVLYWDVVENELCFQNGSGKTPNRVNVSDNLKTGEYTYIALVSSPETNRAFLAPPSAQEREGVKAQFQRKTIVDLSSDDKEFLRTKGKWMTIEKSTNKCISCRNEMISNLTKSTQADIFCSYDNEKLALGGITSQIQGDTAWLAPIHEQPQTISQTFRGMKVKDVGNHVSALATEAKWCILGRNGDLLGVDKKPDKESISFSKSLFHSNSQLTGPPPGLSATATLSTSTILYINGKEKTTVQGRMDMGKCDRMTIGMSMRKQLPFAGTIVIDYMGPSALSERVLRRSAGRCKDLCTAKCNDVLKGVPFNKEKCESPEDIFPLDIESFGAQNEEGSTKQGAYAS